MQVYEGIYDIVAENLRNADQTFEYRKSTFLCDVMGHPQTLDVSKFIRLTNREFFQAVFVSVFRRLPEKEEYGRWEPRYDMEDRRFQEAVLREMEVSSVAAINHIRFINNPYFQQKRGIRYRLLGTLYGLTDKSFLRELGKKMPQPIQKIIRKVFL